MNCQMVFSGKNKENVSYMTSAKIAKRVIKQKGFSQYSLDGDIGKMKLQKNSIVTYFLSTSVYRDHYLIPFSKPSCKYRMYIRIYTL